GSILTAAVEPSNPLAYGMGASSDVFFSNGQTFRLTGDNARSVVRFDTDTPLRSGWAQHQERLKDTSAVVDIDMGGQAVRLWRRGDPTRTATWNIPTVLQWLVVRSCQFVTRINASGKTTKPVKGGCKRGPLFSRRHLAVIDACVMRLTIAV